VHEIGYCEAVLEAVEQRAAGRPVARIGVRAGTLHRLVPAAFEQSFQLVAAGTVAEGASTDMVSVPATGVCVTCANRFSTAEPAATCPSCGGFEVDLEGGDELTLAWIEYAAGPRPEIAPQRIERHSHAEHGSDHSHSEPSHPEHSHAGPGSERT
jgi:hydrogenase nickel incorporation protein HypA/HybF